MRRFQALIVFVSSMVMVACAANGPQVRNPQPDAPSTGEVGMECYVARVVGNVVHTEGCQGWQPLQFGKRGYCNRIIKLSMQGNSFTLQQSRSCKHFSLRHPDGTWLMITPQHVRKQKNLCFSRTEPNAGAFIPCSHM